MPRIAAALAVAALAVACKKQPPPSQMPVDPGAAPILPAPEATRYAIGAAGPRDPLVARVVEQGLLPWQESLAGAATALALESEPAVDLQQAGHAARRAGYPYPVVRIIVGAEPPATFPTGLLAAVQRVLKLGDHVGVVRARVANEDRWVALVGRPRGLAQPFDRVVEVGARVVLEADRAATWRAILPTGESRTGATPTELQLDVPGEWWIELEDRHGDRILGVPVYAGMAPPKGPLLELPGDLATGPDEAEEQALDQVDRIREAFAQPALLEDGTLTTLARHPLDQLLDGAWSAEAGEARLRGAGFQGGPLAQLTCRAPTVPLCIDQMLTSADGRAALLHPQMRLVGVAAQASTDGVAVALNLASE